MVRPKIWHPKVAALGSPLHIVFPSPKALNHNTLDALDRKQHKKKLDPNSLRQPEA